MKQTRIPPAKRRGEHGVALIITLFFIIIITVMIVGFIDSSRVERSAATSHLDRLRAGNFAREGIELTQATLQRETVDPAKIKNETTEAYNKRKRNWISQPGALVVPADASSATPNPDLKQIRKEVMLSSGAPSAGWASLDPLLHPPRLNVQTLVEQDPATYLISDRRDPKTNQVPEMRLRWVYVRQDGSYDLPNLKAPIANAQLPPNAVPANLPIENPDLTNKTNPIVGRFAFWVDDESSKVNYNLAWKRDTAATTTANANTSQEAHPSRINLLGLTLANNSPITEPMADTLHNWIVKPPARYFNSFADARQVSPDIAKMLDFNRFDLTHYNHDPDTTFFGEDRIMLTTNRKLVPRNPDGTYARKFLDILRDDKADPDPGILEDIAGGQPDWNADPNGGKLLPNKLDAVVRNVMRYVSEKNWPLSPATSFKEKYYPNTSDTSARIGQIAINVIDYVRAKESPTQVIAPLRYAVGPSNAVGDNINKFTLHPSYTYGAANSYQGICRAPYITEAGMWMEKDPTPPPAGGWPGLAGDANQNKPMWRCYFKGELYLPLNYGFPAQGIELVPDISASPKTGSSGYFFTWTETRDQTVTNYYGINPAGVMKNMKSAGNNAGRIMKGDLAGGAGTAGTSLTPGSYVTVTKMFYRDKDHAGRATLATRMVLYYGTQGADGFLSGNGSRWPRVNIATQAAAISYPVGSPTAFNKDSMPSIEVDDPRCNIHPKDWVYNKGGNTFGRVNSVSSLGKSPTLPAGKPQQDTDDRGKITDLSLYMPPPKGVGTNGPTQDDGRLTSIAELGYVHTGNDANTDTPVPNGNTGSVPWRTIRLQPNNYSDSKLLPDWAFMDLFTVPNTGATGSDALYKPHGTAVGGRVNVNSHVEPFDDKLVRDRGLVALFTGTRNLIKPEDAPQIAYNIYNRILADGTNKGKIYGYPWKTTAAPSDPNAYDTPGEICEIKGVADGGEKSEDLIREIASLVTSRGGVFTVYTIGQALKQTPNGKLIITAEQRQQAMLERYLDNKGTPDAGDDETRFRNVYFRNLTP